MKNLTIILSVTLLISFFFSCKKDKKNEPTPPITYPNYSQLKVGNSWVYQEFFIDSLRNEIPKNTFDSCYVEKDTVINNHKYFKVFRPSFDAELNYSFLRDSLHYIVNSEGKILFSSQDFNTFFTSRYILGMPNDTVCKVTMKMEEKDLPAVTPAGTFITSNAKVSFSWFPKWYNSKYPTFKNMKYAENIGVVVETLPIFIGMKYYTERRLIRYHLN